MDNGLLRSQKRLHVLQDQRRALLAKLAEVETALAQAENAHRAQIARSLVAIDPEEASMARLVAAWWEVPFPVATN